VEPCVFQHNHRAGLLVVNKRFFVVTAVFAGENHGSVLAQFFLQIRRNRGHPVLAFDVLVQVKSFTVFFGLCLGLLGVLCGIAKVAHQREGLCPVGKNVLYRGNGGHNPGVVLNHAVLHGYIEIYPHYYPFPVKVYGFDSFNHYFAPALIMWQSRATKRLE